ncbi:MAG: hypothetical protein ACT4OY_00300 [Alphaproteobacteria bacterium]
MGKLISPPKAPPIIMAAPPPVPASAPTETPEEAAARVRRADLLQRERGMFGTVRTGFRGLLDLAGQGAPRKTLLGE